MLQLGSVVCVSRLGTCITCGIHPWLSIQSIDFESRIISQNPVTKKGNTGGFGFQNGIGF